MNDTAKLKLIDGLYAKIPTFQCVEGCTACCGPILMSRLEWGRIVKASGRVEKEIKQAAQQSVKSGKCDCPFIDHEKGSCSIHDNRPAICRLFGAVDHPRLTCPYGKRPDVLLTEEQSSAILDQINKLGR